MKKGELSGDILSISRILMFFFLKAEEATHRGFCYFLIRISFIYMYIKNYFLNLLRIHESREAAEF